MVAHLHIMNNLSSTCYLFLLLPVCSIFRPRNAPILKLNLLLCTVRPEECFKVTPGKGHSVHGSYEADGPSEGLVVKLTTTSGKERRWLSGGLVSGVGFGGWFRGLVRGYHFGDVKVVERFFFCG